MYPELSESDCQAAFVHYRQLIAEGQRQQMIARAVSAWDPAQSGSDAIRRRLAHFGGLRQRLRRAARPASRAARPSPTTL
jgi:hypothetical protein